MNLIFPDVALVWMLLRVVGPGLKYHLYTNNATPGVGSSLGSFNEAIYSGYAPILVPAASWNVSMVTGHVGDLEAPPIAFNNTSGLTQRAYGYYVTDQGGTQLVCAARFDSPPEDRAFGDAWVIEPILGSYSGLDS